MEAIDCRLCNSKCQKVFDTKLLSYNVNFYQCSNCRLIQSEKPYWLEEAYKDSISILDTGILYRNLDLLNKVLVVISSFGKNYKNILYRILKLSPFSEKVLDYGGGYGILVRLLRDVGVDTYWKDKYSNNLYAKGFEWEEGKPKILVSFELWEHFENPKIELDNIFKLYSPDVYIFSTLLYEEKVPSKDWWYYNFETGQHIAFYNENTIQHITQLYGYKYLKLDGGFYHILTKIELDHARISKNFFRSKWLSFFAKRIYQSKTFSDHLYLKDKLNKNIRIK